MTWIALALYVLGAVLAAWAVDQADTVAFLNDDGPFRDVEARWLIRGFFCVFWPLLALVALADHIRRSVER